MEIDFNKINLEQVRDDVNLILFNSKMFSMQDMKNTNELIERLKNVKIHIN